MFGAKVHGTGRLLELRFQGLGFECALSGVCAYSKIFKKPIKLLV